MLLRWTGRWDTKEKEEWKSGRVEEAVEEERPCAASGEDSLASESCVTEEKNHSISQCACDPLSLLSSSAMDTPSARLLGSCCC